MFSDLWHYVLVDWSWQRLLLLHIALELVILFGTAFALAVVCFLDKELFMSPAETQTSPLPSFGNHLWVSAHKVYFSQLGAGSFRSSDRFADDSFAGEAGVNKFLRFSVGEALVFSVQTFTHWLLLSVSGAVIVARAMRPQPQLAWAHDCVIDQEELVVRVKVSRGLPQERFVICAVVPRPRRGFRRKLRDEVNIDHNMRRERRISDVPRTTDR